MLKGSYKIGLPSKGRQEFGAGRLVLWGLLKPGVVLGGFGVMAVEDDCASVLCCSFDVVCHGGRG